MVQWHVEHQNGTGFDLCDSSGRFCEGHRAVAVDDLAVVFVDEKDAYAMLAEFCASPFQAQHEVEALVY